MLQIKRVTNKYVKLISSMCWSS